MMKPGQVRHMLLKVLRKVLDLATSVPKCEETQVLECMEALESHNPTNRRKASIQCHVTVGSPMLEQHKEHFLVKFLDEYVEVLVNILSEVAFKVTQVDLGTATNRPGRVSSSGQTFHIRFGQDIVELAALLSSAFCTRKPETDEYFLKSQFLEKCEDFLFTNHLNNQIQNSAFQCLASALSGLNTPSFNYVVLWLMFSSLIRS